MLTLNRALAIAMVQGPGAGLALLDTRDADPRITGSHRLAAVRAQLLDLAGDHETAVTHYRAAAEQTTSRSEREYLLRQAHRTS
ncbi:hypothetical protein [Streptomyces sp. NPDC051211]|uniref:hypothetical protein n=1 Tax=Streptomyces sp. NPDC051211 TaxID=3154643 RepID=UPI00344BB203